MEGLSEIDQEVANEIAKACGKYNLQHRAEGPYDTFSKDDTAQLYNLVTKLSIPVKH